MPDSKQAAKIIIDQWLKDVANRWEEGCRDRDMDKLRDIPPSPGHVSFGDLVDELRSRVTVVRQ